MAATHPKDRNSLYLIPRAIRILDKDLQQGSTSFVPDALILLYESILAKIM